MMAGALQASAPARSATDRIPTIRRVIRQTSNAATAARTTRTRRPTTTDGPNTAKAAAIRYGSAVPPYC